MIAEEIPHKNTLNNCFVWLGDKIFDIVNGLMLRMLFAVEFCKSKNKIKHDAQTQNLEKFNFNFFLKKLNDCQNSGITPRIFNKNSSDQYIKQKEILHQQIWNQHAAHVSNSQIKKSRKIYNRNCKYLALFVTTLNSRNLQQYKS